MQSEISVASNAAPPPPVVFTDAAAQKVGELIKEEQNDELKLRVFISGGGCSGFQYAGFSTVLHSMKKPKMATARSSTWA